MIKGENPDNQEYFQDCENNSTTPISKADFIRGRSMPQAKL